MNITELAMFKKIAGKGGSGGSALLQERAMIFGANGTRVITPDEGYDGISRVNITVDVPAFYDLYYVGNLNSYFETELDKQNIYRARAGLYLHMVVNEAANIQLGGNTYIVDELPEIGEPVSIDGKNINVVYYNRADGIAYGYMTDELASEFGISAGWYDIGTVLQPLDVPYSGVVTNFENMTVSNTIYFIANTLYLVYSDDAWAWYAPSVDVSGGGGGGGEVVSYTNCKVSFFDDEGNGSFMPITVSYKTYENGELKNASKQLEGSSVTEILAVQGTEMFIDKQFNYWVDDPRLSGLSIRNADNGAYIIVPYLEDCYITISSF